MKVIISGAGIVGLLIAQNLKIRGIDYVILDRDTNENARGQGWGITLHWALQTFLDLLPSDDLREKVFKAQVFPDFDKKDTGTFKYINAANGETVVSIPPARRLRVRREEIRRILLTGLDVNWDCQTVKVEYTDIDVTVHCADGRSFTGDILFGCEGSDSVTRKILDPLEGSLTRLPIRFVGSTCKMNKQEYDFVAAKYDPLLFQGTIPSTETFFWFSLLASPNYTKAENEYWCQVNLSWKCDFEKESFKTQEEIKECVIDRTRDISPDLKFLVNKMVSNDFENGAGLMKELKLADWPKVSWKGSDRILLAGDAAHAMTMYRGEAANHGITDVAVFFTLFDDFLNDRMAWSALSSTYHDMIHERCAPAVKLSHQACMDAHDMTKIFTNSSSPLLSSRKL